MASTPTRRVSFLGRLRERRSLRKITEHGDGVVLDGQPKIENLGAIRLGARVRVLNRPVAVELGAGPGSELVIGADSVLEPGATITANGTIAIGERVHVGRYAVIMDSNFHDLYERDKQPAPQPIHIEDDARIGANSCVLPGVRVGAGAVVLPGSVVTKDVEPASVVVGVPARPVPSVEAAAPASSQEPAHP